LTRILLLAALLVAGCAHPSLVPAATVGADGRLVAPQIGREELDAWRVLGGLPDRAMSLGAGNASLVGASLTIENDWIGGFVYVPEDVCILAYARGAHSVADVDVAVYSDDGAILALDEARDPHPTVVLCPPHPTRVYVAGHVAEGEGLVAVAAHLVPKERATALAQGLGVHGPLDQGFVPGDAGPGLDDTVQRHYLELGGQWQEVRRLLLSVDARVPAYVAVAIDAGRCVDAFVVPVGDLGPVDAEIVDADGRTLSRSRDGTGPRSLTVCSPAAATGTLAVRPHIGRGLAAVVLARASVDLYRDMSSRPEVGWFSPKRSLQAAKTLLEATLSGHGYGAPTMTTLGLLTPAARTSIALDLKTAAGSCMRVDVTAGEPLALVIANLWSDGGSLLATDEGPSSALLFACAHGGARLELEARERSGPYSVAVRPERWRDPAFERLPLAASRMLARVASEPEKILEGQVQSVRIVSIDSANGVSWGESVPAGKCMHVTAGVEGDGAGLELRAFDEAHAEIDRAEAPDAAAVRTCAPASAGRLVHFEMRASAGSLKAIVGETVE
jgi:hypothetical protein